MEFPSLLFAGEKTEQTMSREVCEDLKLDLLFPEDVTNLFLFRPTAENIEYRQELFSELLKNTGLCETLRELEKTLRTASGLYLSQNKAVCEAVEIYIFPHLLSYIMEFSRTAAAIPAESRLLRQFRDAFAGICGEPRFSEAEKRAPEVRKRLSEASSLFIKTDGDNAKH